MAPYLEFVKAGVQTLLERQSTRLGGQPDGVPCITVTQNPGRTWRSLGQCGDPSHTTLVQEQPLEEMPYRLDLNMWPVLELFSDITGDPQYRQMVVEAASAFKSHGFDPVSGLGYLGVQTEFDVLRLQPVPPAGFNERTLKPAANLPLDRLWAEVPGQMARMFKSAYYGLITRPETMDYNRYCSYGFDDAAKKPSMAFNYYHVAFALTGAILIHWWSFHFARTGDAECVAWAQAMADKWQAVQHPESGLIPYCFGGDVDTDQWRAMQHPESSSIPHHLGGDQSRGSTMPPWPYVDSGETTTAITLLWAAGELKKRPEGRKLAEQVDSMAQRLLKGVARYGYDLQERIFPRWFYLDGQVRKETTFYCFYSQTEKDEAAMRNPILREVPVCPGAGFYAAWPWAIGAQNRFPYDVALGASLTDDSDLLARAQEFAGHIVEEAGKQTSAFNALGQWTYPASASYIKMMLLLFKTTKASRYLDWARQLADKELKFLSESVPANHPEWWRMPFRGDLLEALGCTPGKRALSYAARATG